MEKYPWYAIVDDKEPLLQGDFINSCPIVIPRAMIEFGKVTTDVVEYDVAIMSQSCDLAQRKLDLVLVCPVWPLSDFAKSSQLFESRRGKRGIKTG